jgi:hypothetical protein
MRMRTLGVLILATAAFLSATPLAAASSQACVSVRLDAPFRLPDGSVHPAGELTLCDTRAFSPVVSLHQVLVDGSIVGMFQSRRRGTEMSLSAAPEVVFERDPEGTLALVGYILSDSGRSTAFRMKGNGGVFTAARRKEATGGAAPLAGLLTVSATH